MSIESTRHFISFFPNTLKLHGIIAIRKIQFPATFPTPNILCRNDNFQHEVAVEWTFGGFLVFVSLLNKSDKAIVSFFARRTLYNTSLKCSYTLYFLLFCSLFHSSRRLQVAISFPSGGWRVLVLLLFSKALSENQSFIGCLLHVSRFILIFFVLFFPIPYVTNRKHEFFRQQKMMGGRSMFELDVIVRHIFRMWQILLLLYKIWRYFYNLNLKYISN